MTKTPDKSRDRFALALSFRRLQSALEGKAVVVCEAATVPIAMDQEAESGLEAGADPYPSQAYL